MRIAIPLTNPQTALHAGRAARFALLDIDPTENTILRREDIDAPPHEPGRVPHWLAEHGVDVVIAAGLGRNAIQLFTALGIHVVLGEAVDSPEVLVNAYLATRSH